MTSTPLISKAVEAMELPEQQKRYGTEDLECANAELKQKEAEAEAVLPLPPNERTRFKQFTMGFIVTITVAFSWVLSTQFAKTAMVYDKKKFNAPYFIMWFNTSHMILCFPMYILFALYRKQTVREAYEEGIKIFKNNGLTPLSLVKYVLPFLIMWSAANYTYMRSLGLISASILTSVSASNAAVVYALSLLILGDNFMLHKLLAVMLAISGVVVLSWDGEITAEPQGVILAVASAVSAACYKVLFKKVLVEPTFAQVAFFMTCLGSINIFINAIPAFGLLFTPWEWISSAGSVPWLALFGNAILSLIFNFTINFGIAILHPLVISVGMLVGIPLNAVIDVLFRDVILSTFMLTGTSLIIVSFSLIIIRADIVALLIKRIRQRE